MTSALSTSTTTVSSFDAQLAELILDNEDEQAKSDRLERDAARAAYISESQQQVDALHKAASDQLVGALVSSAFSVAAGACGVAGAGNDKSLWTTTGKALSTAAAPVKSVGDAIAADTNADAKNHEIRAEEAKWRLDDAASELDKTDKRGDKVLDTVQAIDSEQNSSTTSIIGRI
jgi:hypothetical protein